MKSLSLIISLILSVGYLIPVQAVTDAELEALEKQIEQQEAEEKKQIEAAEKKKAEAKRRVEQKRKAEAEMERRRLAEQKRIEEARLAELDRQRQEEETKKRAEEEKKEKYNLLIAEAKQAINDKDKELAISKYNEALTITPGDPVANSGIKEAEKLKHKVCYEVLGTWQDRGEALDLKENGTYEATNVASSTWKCTDPKNRTIEIQIPLATLTAVLSGDGQCLNASSWAGGGVFNRPGHICNVAQPKEPVKQNPHGL